MTEKRVIYRPTGKAPTFPNDNWTRVEIFLRAYGRLPDREGDMITQETLELFCKKWEAGEIETSTVNLKQVYDAIKRGDVTLEKTTTSAT